MNAFLVRHAEAEDTLPDEARRLTPHGRRQVNQLATFFRRSQVFAPDEIWHSPLTRAHETAALLADALKQSVPRREVQGLTPEDDPEIIAHLLATVDYSVAVVGHEPHLSALATLMLTGPDALPIVRMQKGAVLALERAGRSWVVQWHVSPELIT